MKKYILYILFDFYINNNRIVNIQLKKNIYIKFPNVET